MAPWPEGVGRQVLASTDSTMLEAARQATTVSGATWICALEQTAARGRRGRPWVNPTGNFAASLVMHPGGAPASAALRSFVAALALQEAFIAVTGRSDCFGLKWPNDVLLNGGKVAGILLESVGQAGRVDHLIIGIGVNLKTAPSATDIEADAVRPVSLLSETGADVAPDAFLDHLAPAFAALEAEFLAYGFAPIRDKWLRHAARLGETITARTGTTETIGRFEDVDIEGNLVLKTPKGLARIAAADIYF